MNKNVLHIATWYPTGATPNSVPFIKAHYEALRSFGCHRLIHVEVSPDGRFGLDWHFGTADNSRARLGGFRGPTRFREWLTMALLALVRLRLGRRNWAVVLVHVAWPTFRFPWVFRSLFGDRIVIVEHWSAYAKDFNLDPDSSAHARMRRMFSTDTPVIAVSKGLAADIKAFAQRDDLDVHVVSNVVDSRFHFEGPSMPTTIFMAANWNDFRKPFLVLQAMPDLIAACPKLRLSIAGGGPQLASMKAHVDAQSWSERVTFLGQVSRDRIAMEMRRATLFAHPTTHETFSVVTAEAMCCGVPVVVSNVGALPELVIPGETGYLVDNDTALWRDALLRALDTRRTWKRKKIASESRDRFSPESVGLQIATILSEVAAK